MKKKTSVISFISLILLILLDQITKYLAVAILKPYGSVKLIPGVFELTYLENRGAAFGMLQGGRLLFLPLTIIIILIFLFAFYRLSFDRKFMPIRVIMVVFIAGAIGNFIDRLVNGYVVDFFYFCYINFPVFNVADIYVTCSCVIFFFLVLFIYKDHDWDEAFLATKKDEGIE